MDDSDVLACGLSQIALMFLVHELVSIFLLCVGDTAEKPTR